MSEQQRRAPERAFENRGPDGYFLLVTAPEAGGAVDVTRMLGVLWAARRLLFAAAFGSALLAAAGSLLLPNIYEARVLMVPVTQNVSGAANALNARFGGLAALAGVDFGAADGNKEEYIATLRSDGFVRDFIVAENLITELFADEWDPQRRAWRDEGDAPTLEDAVELFREEVCLVTEDRLNGLVTLAVRWYSPELAALWANRMVERVNERLRAEAIARAEESIAYLTKEADKTGVVEIRQAIFRVIESQVSNAMLANVQREYAFKVVDPAVPPDLKHKVAPIRSLIAVGSGFVGGVLAVFIVLSARRREWLSAAAGGGTSGEPAPRAS